MSEVYRIRIQSDADPRGVQEMLGKFKELGVTLEKTSALSKGLVQGFGLGIGSEVITRVAQIPAFLSQAVTEGIRFNSTLEGAKLGIAAVIKQFDTSGRFGNFEVALGAAGDAIDLLKQKAKESPATFEQLVQGFQGLSGAFASAGLSMKQQVDLVVTMSQALSGLGIRSDQLLQESRALVSGNINEDAMAARILGITKAQVDSARESGTLFDFLSGKLAAFKEAGEAGAGSVAVQFSNLEDSLQQLQGIATAELFEQIRGGLSGINAELGKDSAERAAAGLGTYFAGLVDGGTQLVGLMRGFNQAVLQNLPGWMQELAKGNWLEDKAFGSVKNLFEAGSQDKLSQQAGAESKALQEQLANAKDEKSEKAAIEAIEKAIAARRQQGLEASEAEQSILQNHVLQLGNILQQRERIAGSAAGGSGNWKNWFGDAKAFDKGAKARAGHDARSGKLTEEVEGDALDEMGPREKVARLREQVDEMRRSFADDIANKGVELGSGFDPQQAAAGIAGMGGDPEAAEHFEQRLRRIIELTKELDSTNSKIGKTEISGRDMVKELQEELSIQRELASGHDLEAQKLEIQRDLRKEIARISEADLLPSERARALELASQTAQMREQKAIADQQKKQTEAREKIGEMKPDLDGSEKTTGGKGARARREAREDFLGKVQREAKDAGIGGADLKSLLAEKGGEFDEKMQGERGRFGNDAKPDPRAVSVPDVFKKPRAGFGDSPALDIFGPKPPTPLGDIVPTPAGAPQGGGDKAADAAAAMDGAASATDQAANDLSKAGQALSGAGQANSGAAGVLAAAAAQMSSAASQIQMSAAGIASAIPGIASAVQNIEARLANLESSCSSH